MANNIENALLVRMEATLSKFEKQMAKGVQVADRSSQQIERRVGLMNGRIAANSNKAAAAFSRVTSISGRGRFVLQNTANQIGDIAVQLEGGTSAMRVMGQQFPQLLGGFGALGGVLGVVAPLLGTIAAIGFPVAAALLLTKDRTDDTAQSVQTFSDAFSEAEGAVNRARSAVELASKGGIENLRDIYGEVTQKVRELSVALADIEVRAAKVEVGQVIDQALGQDYQATLDEVFGTVGSAIAQSATEGAAEAVTEIKNQIAALQAEIDTAKLGNNSGLVASLQAELQVMEEELAAVEGRISGIGSLAAEMSVPPEVVQSYAEIEERMRAANDAGNFAGVADALAEIRVLLETLGDAVEQEVIDEITKAEDITRQLSATLGDAAAAAGDVAATDMASTIAAAADQAGRLATNLEAAAQRQYVQSRILGDAPAGVGAGKAEYVQSRIIGDNYAKWREEMERLNTKTPVRRGGGGGGGGGGAARATDQFARELDSLRAKLDPAWQAQKRYEEALVTLDKALVQGKISQEEYNRYVAESDKVFLDAAEGLDEFEGALAGLSDDLAGVLLGFEDLGDTAARVFEEMARNLLASNLQTLLTGLFGGLGGGGGFFGGLFGTALGLPGFDGGGFTGSGARSGGLDGKGGFLAMLHPNETVIDHTRGQGGGSISVAVSVQTSSENPAEIGEETARAVRSALVPLVDSRIAQGMRPGGVLHSTYAPRKGM